MAGAGFKTFNTGDVLTASDVNTYLMQQTVMVFADATARSTALGANLAQGMLSFLKSDNNLYKYNGSAWVNVDTGSTSPLTTKGDLYTYSTTDTRLPVGSNGYTLVADSSTSTGLAYSGTVLGNPVLNSAFQIWQRGTSISLAASTTAANGYNADRWDTVTGTNQACTISRQTTNDTTNLPNIQYALRYQRNSGQTGTAALYLVQSFETINSIPYAGKQVTLSFYARAGANYSAASSALPFYLQTGTGTDQNQFSGYTGAVNAISSTATLTTTWQRFTATGTLATNATEMAILFAFTPTGTAGANDWYEVTGVQIDLGATALPFRTYANTIQGELAACQRYYYRQNAQTAYTHFASSGFSNATTNFKFVVATPVEMRIVPTSIDFSNLAAWDGGATYTFSAVTIEYCNKQQIGLTGTSTGMTTNRPGFVLSQNTTSAYLGINAEL